MPGWSRSCKRLKLCWNYAQLHDALGTSTFVLGMGCPYFALICCQVFAVHQAGSVGIINKFNTVSVNTSCSFPSPSPVQLHKIHASSPPLDGNRRGGVPKSVFVIHDQEVFVYFEDWLRPLLYTLGMFADVHMVAGNFAPSAVPPRDGDLILVVQKAPLNLLRVPGADYWFVNTEGPDKDFAAMAILQQNLSCIVDYCLYNVDRHLQLGASRAIWLPIVSAPSVVESKARTSLCMVRGANTHRRKLFWGQLQHQAQQRGLKIPFRLPKGWREHRDSATQHCALVVNVASLENNHAMPRLRLDVLWQYDISIVSERMLGADEAEYQGTVLFADFPDLVNATLAAWERIQRRDPGAGLSPKTSTQQRLRVQISREKQFRLAVQTLLKSPVSGRNTSFSSVVGPWDPPLARLRAG